MCFYFCIKKTIIRYACGSRKLKNIYVKITFKDFDNTWFSNLQNTNLANTAAHCCVI